MHVHVEETAKHQGLLESYYLPSESCKSKTKKLPVGLPSLEVLLLIGI